MFERHGAPPALEGLVVECSAWDIATAADDVHLGLPGPTATLIVSLGDPLDTGWFDAGATRGFRMLLAGLHVRPSLVRTHGSQVGIQVQLTPEAVARCFGVPIAALRGELVELGDLDPEARFLAERLAGEPSWPARVAIVERWLARLAHRDDAAARRVHPAATAAWHAFAAGGATVGGLADRLELSRRRLSAIVGAAYGVTPKQLARLHRFDRARRLATAGMALADVAARCGYADQSHLTNDWRDLAARSPRATVEAPFVAARELGVPILQDPARAGAR